ncbi:MAG: hypothetical protein IJZ72_03305 [Oscillospiraceae bacterium]|nr:hypothetical protein [Oscillospiraceae bacterium]
MAKVTVKRIAKAAAQETEQQTVKAVTEELTAPDEQVTQEFTAEELEIIENIEKLTPARKYALDQTLGGFEAGTLSTDPTQLYLFAGERIGEYKAYELTYDTINDDYFEAHVRLEELDSIAQAAKCYCDNNFDLAEAETVITNIYTVIQSLAKSAVDHMLDGENKLLSIKRPGTVKAS